MGNYENVIMNYDVTKSNMMDHIQISEDEAKALKNLGEINEDLMNHWFGEAGDIFQMMASTVEVEMGDAIRFSDNCSVGNDQLIIGFTEEDANRAGSIEITADEGEDG